MWAVKGSSAVLRMSPLSIYLVWVCLRSARRWFIRLKTQPFLEIPMHCMHSSSKPAFFVGHPAVVCELSAIQTALSPRETSIDLGKHDTMVLLTDVLTAWDWKGLEGKVATWGWELCWWIITRCFYLSIYECQYTIQADSTITEEPLASEVNLRYQVYLDGWFILFPCCVGVRITTLHLVLWLKKVFVSTHDISLLKDSVLTFETEASSPSPFTVNKPLWIVRVELWMDYGG